MLITFPEMLGLVVVGILLGPDPSGGAATSYLTEKNGRKELKAPLTIREEQSGFIGRTGMVLTIKPSGEWTVERFRPGEGGKEQATLVRSGTLPPSKLEALAKALATHDLAGLPTKEGQAPRVNPHRLTIRFGQKTSTLDGLPPRRGASSLANHVRDAAPKNEPASKVWERLAGIVHAVEEACESPKTP